jgi:glycerol uptake facilitator protein
MTPREDDKQPTTVQPDLEKGGVPDQLEQPQIPKPQYVPCFPIRREPERAGPRKGIWTRLFLRQLFAEAVGTFIIVVFGTGSVMSAIFGGALQGLFQVAAVWIIAVTIAIATTGPISGAHLNPAISIAFAALRPSSNFGWNKVLPYCVAQTIGAMFASWLNLMMYAPLIRVFEEDSNIVRGSPESIASAKAFGQYYLPPVTTITAFFVEAFGTALLAFVIFSLTHHRNEDIKKAYIPPLIGMTVGGLISVLAPLTQAGFNPARDFGPRVVAYFAGWEGVAFQGWWVYVVAPVVGAPLGGFVADCLLFADVPSDATATTLE